MKSGQRQALGAAYESAVYELDLPHGPAAFHVGPNQSPLPPFVIITAWNPGSQRPPESENRAANARLEALLNENGYNFVNACGRDAESAHVEPSFAVFNVSVDDALAIAERFGQAAIFAWDGSLASLAWSPDAP